MPYLRRFSLDNVSKLDKFKTKEKTTNETKIFLHYILQTAEALFLMLQIHFNSTNLTECLW